VDSDTVTWIGTIFSFIGAAIALWQGIRAKKAAKRAEEMRNEIATKYAHRQLSSLDGLLSAACKAMDKYGPGRSANSLRGTSPSGDADAVRAFTAEFDRNRNALRATFGSHIDGLRDRLHRLLDEFASASNNVERLPKGREIYVEITTFSGNMKQALDVKTFGKADLPN